MKIWKERRSHRILALIPWAIIQQLKDDGDKLLLVSPDDSQSVPSCTIEN